MAFYVHIKSLYLRVIFKDKNYNVVDAYIQNCDREDIFNLQFALEDNHQLTTDNM